MVRIPTESYSDTGVRVLVSNFHFACLFCNRVILAGYRLYQDCFDEKQRTLIFKNLRAKVRFLAGIELLILMVIMYLRKSK